MNGIEVFHAGTDHRDSGKKDALAKKIALDEAPYSDLNPLTKRSHSIATEIIAPLIDPVKVAKLKGDRPANPRLYKVLYWLEIARERGGKVSDTN